MLQLNIYSKNAQRHPLSHGCLLPRRPVDCRFRHYYFYFIGTAFSDDISAGRWRGGLSANKPFILPMPIACCCREYSTIFYIIIFQKIIRFYTRRSINVVIVIIVISYLRKKKNV